MLCYKCSNEVKNNSKFCPFCGAILNVNTNNVNNASNVNNVSNANNINNVNNVSNINNVNNKKNSLTNFQKIIIIVLLSVVVLFFLLLLLIPDNLNNKRTVMIYIVGSNLETDAGIVTADLEAIDPDKIDLTKNNILLYTGGTAKWHNFISNQDNGIYILKENGFEKLESQEQLNLGAPETLADFLKYSYKNYKASKYDLILYDHGGAIDGAIYDDISLDNLSLEDMVKAMELSPFNENNKLDAVLFRTCLNGTIELANVFKDYSNYLIASEEVSYGSGDTNVLGFLNNVLINDNGLEFGKKYINSYNEQMEILDPYDDVISTYSVIDLKEIDSLNKELDNYIKEIDLSKNYKEIAQIRSQLYQYGNDGNGSGIYDMVDLYELADKTKEYTENGADNLLNLINKAVKYNKSNSKSSHGISIYFPYNAKETMKYKFLDVYEQLDYSNEYKNFINTFHKLQKSPSGYSFSLNENKLSFTEDSKNLTIELTPEQLETYQTGLFAIFERDVNHPNYYKPLFSSDDVTLNNNILQANINDKMLKMQTEDGTYQYILSYYRKNNNNSRTVFATLYKDTDFSAEDYSSNVTLKISNDKKDPFITSAKLNSVNERIDGILLNLDDYNTVSILTPSYRILDDQGNYTEEWESGPVATGYEEKIKDIKLKNSGLDEGDNYYGIFILKDIYGNTSYSKLIKVGG